MQYSVIYKNKVLLHLNPNMILRQNLTDEDIETIKSLHIEKHKLFAKMKKTNDIEELRRLAKEVEDIEYKLQDAWKFDRDPNKHQWYAVPKCKCPVLDNKDYYGTNLKSINTDCPIHGEQ